MSDNQHSADNTIYPTPRRLRLIFSKGEPLKYISHLDLARAWERIFRRAALPLAYSHGYNPRPRFQIASGLPLGVTGRAELLDLWLAEPLEADAVLARLRPVLPSGLEVLGIVQVDLAAPSLQSEVRAASYEAVVHSPEPVEGIRARLEALLDAPTLPRRRQHKGTEQVYDLRPLIQDVVIKQGAGGEQILLLRLQASPQGAGRPDQVLDALGLALYPHTVERTNLHFEFDK